jgi:hypothetical protein
MHASHREPVKGSTRLGTALAAQLLGQVTRPSEAAIRAEVKIRLQVALNCMDPLDREVLALRPFEQLTPAESAQFLGIKQNAAGMRYLRALKWLKDIRLCHRPDSVRLRRRAGLAGNCRTVLANPSKCWTLPVKGKLVDLLALSGWSRTSSVPFQEA